MKRFYVVFVLVFLFHSQILSQTVSEGVYIIRLAANPSFVVGVNGKVQSEANIVLQTNSGADSQKWRIVHSNGAIILACVANSNCAMDIWGGKPKAGSNIACYSKHDGNNQKWYAEKYGNGYLLRSALNKNYVLDLDHAIAKDGQNILLWPEHKGEGQIWKLERVAADDGKNNKSSEDNVVDAFNKFFNGANSPSSNSASSVSKAKSNQTSSNVPNSTKTKPFLVKKERIDNGYENMQFLYIDKDGNSNTIEILGANYYYRSEGGYKGVIDMYVEMISSIPDKNGRYPIIYTGLKRDKSQDEPRVCSVKAEFGDYLLIFARSPKNNKALIEVDNGDINRLNNGNIPWIEDEVTILYNDKTNTVYDVPRTNSKH